MTPKKQVSPAIRILRGERDASARATHLEAATRKFLVTTNERKYMSTKTNFKRIALVAVAALGLGVLSSVPSRAEVLGTVTLATTNGTALIASTVGAVDSTTAGTVTVTWLAGQATDSMVISSSLTSKPAGAASSKLTLIPKDTATSITAATLKGEEQAPAAATASVVDTAVITSVAAGYTSGTFYAQIDSASGTRLAGTYTYTVIATPWHAAGTTLADTTKVVTGTISITIAALASASKVANAGFSSAVISAAGGGAADAQVSALATASTSPGAVIEVKLRNASGLTGTAARESVTVTTTIGTVGLAGGTFGKSVVLQYDSNDSLTVQVRPDGTAGTGTIKVSTPSVTFTDKNISFYSATVSTINATMLSGTLKTGSNTAAIMGVAKDSNKIISSSATAVYAYSSDTAVVSTYGTACTYSADDLAHFCSLTGVSAGTAKITLRNAATVALSTVASTEAITVTVTTSPVASFKLAFNKASYAPGEKAYITITPIAADGKVVGGANTYANMFAAGGITSSVAFGNGSDTTTNVSVATSSRTTLTPSTDAIGRYTVFMPSSGGTVTITATGGTSLPAAGQVAVTATATVTDSGAAALAAVTALATTVASLKTLITTLTNLVLKIQKKVKA